MTRAGYDPATYGLKEPFHLIRRLLASVILL